MRQRILAGLCLVFAVATPARSGEQALTLKDWTGRGFAPDLVNYTLPMPADGGRSMRVLAADGTSIPVQITPADSTNSTQADSRLRHDATARQAKLSFVAEIPAGGVSSYTVRNDGKDPVPSPGVTVAAEKDSLVLANQKLAIRVPAPRDQTFDKPVTAKTLPAPLLAFRGPDGGPSTMLGTGWRGEGAMASRREVRRIQVLQLAQGPVFAEVRYRLEYEGGGYYQATLRVTDRSPLADITEEYDLGKLDGSDSWVLNLSKGWAPDTGEFMLASGQGFTPVTRLPLSVIETNIPTGVNGWVTPRLDDEGETPVRQFYCEGFGARYVSYFGAIAPTNALVPPGQNPFAMVVMLHKGNWRRPNSMPIYVKGSTVRVRFPMGVTPMSWFSEPGSETSPFSLHTHDPSLPVTYGRRQWGLLLARPAINVWAAAGQGAGYSACNLYGTVGLDRYKDYILSWKDSGVVYPRLFMSPEDVQPCREAIAADPQSPLLPLLKTYYWFTGDTNTAARELVDTKRGLAQNISYIMTSLAIAHHQTGGAHGTVMAHAESLLSWPGLSPEDRAWFRGMLALHAYLMIEPDVMSQGNGAHHGPPNMGLARQMDMPTPMALVPDHPMHDAWLDYMGRFTAYKAGSLMAPEGAWNEYGVSYHMHGYGKLMRGLMGLFREKSPLADALWAYNRTDLEYYLNLLTPVDPRFGSRVLPGTANSPPGCPPHYYLATGTVAARDRDFAANLLWGWNASGRYVQGGGDSVSIPAMGRPWVGAKEPVLRSRVFPGFGVVFRAHQGPDETYMVLRSGYHWSHWTQDQGNLFLYSKGAPLVPCQPFQYYWPTNKVFDQYNLIRFGSTSNLFPQSWSDANILDAHFEPGVDYAWASMGFPEWYITPGSKPGWSAAIPRQTLVPGLGQQEGAFNWDRQVLFLKGATGKSPNYFVVRDSCRPSTGSGQGGKLASWFNLNLLGRKGNLRVEKSRLTLDTEWPTKLEVLFPGRVALPFEMNEDNPPGGGGGSYGRISGQVVPGAPLSRDWIGKDGKPASLPANPPAAEQHVQLRLQGAPGEDYAWILYPRGEGETSPVAEPLAPGVMKVTTSESTDYVFMGITPVTFEKEGVVFSGSAGAVRIPHDPAAPVTLVLSSGPGKVGYQKDVVASQSPFQQTVPRGNKAGKPTVLSASVRTLAVPTPLPAAQLLVAGVSRATVGDVVEYVVNEPGRVVARDGAVRIDACEAVIRVEPKAVRFVVPGRTYAQLSVGAVGVRGVGPFDLTFTPDRIEGEVDGEVRTLVTTWPERVVRPMYHQDGTLWFAGFSDEHTISKGTNSPQFSLAVGVSGGRHRVEITEYVWPELPAPPPRMTLTLGK